MHQFYFYFFRTWKYNTSDHFELLSVLAIGLLMPVSGEERLTGSLGFRDDIFYRVG